MKLATLTSFLLLGRCFASSSPLTSTHVEHESQVDGAEHNWIKRSRIEQHTTLPVRIGLAQSNLDHGHDLLMQISDPTSETYGRHLSPEETIDLFAPSKSSIETVQAWLQSNGISSHRISLSTNKQWLQFDAKATELESLLQTEYHHYEHLEHGSETVACESYHVPRDIQPHIDFVKPGILGTFGYIEKHEQSYAKREVYNDARSVDTRSPKGGENASSQNCSEVVTPACVRKLYNITDTIEKAPGNTIALYESLHQYYNGTDLDLFFEAYAKEIKKGTRPKIKLVAGAPKEKPGVDVRGGTEADLSLQLMYPHVYPDDITVFPVYDRYYQSYRHFPSGEFNVFLDAIDGSYCNKTAFGITGNSPKFDGKIPNPHKGGYKGPLQCGIYKAPKVISFSYVSAEQVLPVPYQRRMCSEFLKLGLQGTSFFFGSGDGGVATKDCKKSTGGYFRNAFPQACPYITSVGGTHFPPNVPVQPGFEIAARKSFPVAGSAIYTSGGGFSNVFPRPAYQDTAVKRYLKNFSPPYPYYKIKFSKRPPTNTSGRYNRIGRGFPDISAIGLKTANVFGQKPRLGYGTSASGPLFASIIARINNRRLAAGKSTLGFINPSLYQNPDMLNDVTEGSNPFCQKGTKGYNHDGFSCTPGWDPVTGLGTPNYGKMLEYYMSLP